MAQGGMEIDILPCPFCDFSDSDPYFLTQHVELCHPENGTSPFIAIEEPRASAQDLNHSNTDKKDSPVDYTGPVANDDDPLSGYVDCPHGCGEIISTAELSSHLDLHIAEEMAFEDASGGVVSKCESEGEEIDANTDYIHDDIESRFSTKLPKELRNRDNILQPKSSRKGSHRDSKAALGPSEKKKRKSKRGSRDAAGSFLRRLGVIDFPLFLPRFIYSISLLIHLILPPRDRN